MKLVYYDACMIFSRFLLKCIIINVIIISKHIFHILCLWHTNLRHINTYMIQKFMLLTTTINNKRVDFRIKALYII